MTESIVLERGKRAGNVLIIQTVVYWALAFLEIIRDEGIRDAFSGLLGGSYILIIYFAIVVYLADGLKRDRIKRIRILYIILAVLYVFLLYASFTDGTSGDKTVAILDAATYILIIIALYRLGNPGKICCFVASGIKVLSLFFSFGTEDFSLSDFGSGVVAAVFYVFLGLFVESKAFYTEEYTIVDPQARSTTVQPETQHDSYDDLVRLKELMDNGVITPAEYEEKKKQILGL